MGPKGVPRGDEKRSSGMSFHPQKRDRNGATQYSKSHRGLEKLWDYRQLPGGSEKGGREKGSHSPVGPEEASRLGGRGSEKKVS